MKKTKIIAGSIAMSILCSLTLNYRASTTVAEDYAESSATHSKITEQLKEKMINSVSEEIPVVIWYDGVDNEVVENSVIDEIGYGIDSLEEQYTKPDDELISELSKAANGDPDKYLEFLMKNYLNMTEETRAIEKDKTETYRRTKREKYKEYNLKDARALINDLEISNDDISFVSSYAPMIVCSLDMNTIDQVSKNDRISEIDFYEELKGEVSSLDLSSTKNSMGITAINNNISLDGSGVKIGIYEPGSLMPQYYSLYGISSTHVHLLTPTIINETRPDHSTWVAGIAAGADGIAPNTEIYSASSNSDWESNHDNPNITSLSNLESLISYGVDIINNCWGANNNSTCYSYWAKYTDQLISNTNTIMVCATGNLDNQYILNTATAYNCWNCQEMCSQRIPKILDGRKSGGVMSQSS